MHRDQIKWLVIGLVSSLVVIAGLGGLSYTGYRFYKKNADRAAASAQETAEEAPEDGPIIWKRRAEEYKKQQAELAPYIAPLQARYTTISPLVDLYKTLYTDHNFAIVEKKLADKYALIADSFHTYEYHLILRYLGALKYDYDPDTLRHIVQRWTEECPESHFAWLVRASVEIEYAWYWRGSTEMKKVTPKGLENFEVSIKAAEDYLARASEIDPRDPVALTFLLRIAAVTDTSDEEFDRLFNRLISVSPACYDAYYVKLVRLMPHWNGSWEQVESFADECDRLAEQLHCPLFLWIRVEAYNEMSRSRLDYEKILERADVMLARVDAARKVAEAWPDNVPLRLYYCNMLYSQNKFVEAYEQFEWIGDRYYEPTQWASLAHYNIARAYTVFIFAADTLSEHTQRVEQFERAIALDESQGIYWYYLGMEHARVYDIKSAEAAFRAGIEKDPDSEYPWFGLAGFLAQAGRYDELAELVHDSRKYYEFSNKTRARLRELGAIAAKKLKEAGAEIAPAEVAASANSTNP